MVKMEHLYFGPAGAVTLTNETDVANLLGNTLCKHANISTCLHSHLSIVHSPYCSVFGLLQHPGENISGKK